MTDLAQWEGSALPDEAMPWPRLGEGLRGAARGHKTTLLSAAAALGLTASACLGIAYVRHQHLDVAQQAAVAHEERANADLQDALSQLRDQVAAVNQALGVAQRQIATLTDRTQHELAKSEQAATSKTDRITQLAHALEQAQRALQLAEAQRATLMARLSMAETAGQKREQWQKKVQELTADRDRAASERDLMRARINEIEQKQSFNRQPAHPGAAPAAIAPRSMTATAAPAVTGPAPAAVAPTQRQVAVVVPGRPQPAVATERAVATATPPEPVAPGRLAEVVRVLSSTGVDVKRMFADFGNRSGLGGPFVPARAGAPRDGASAEKLAALPGLLKTLPVSSPMRGGYRETSPFGERSDPFNGRPAFHPGIDLAAPYGTPVYATAPGVVTFAGWSGGYGKIVEIDHGHGIVTRYGHLERPTVVVGERVPNGAQIGYEGSTGRSTGPHVIYEIDVNGEPQDPAKFMNLARLIPVADRR